MKKRLSGRICSVAVITAMLLTLFACLGTPVMAALTTNTQDFTWWLHSDSATLANWEISVKSISEGGHALYVEHSAETGDTGGIYIMNPYSMISMVTGKKYQLVFDMKEDDPMDGTATPVLLCGTTQAPVKTLPSVDTPGRQGWKTYTYTAPPTMQKSNNPGLYFNMRAADKKFKLYIDNVHIYAMGDGDTPITDVDYCGDGDFETGKNPGYSGSAYKLQDGLAENWDLYGVYGASIVPDFVNATHDVTMDTADNPNARTGNGSIKVVRKIARYSIPAPTLRLITKDTIQAGTYTLTFYTKGDVTATEAKTATAQAGLSWALGTTARVNMGNEVFAKSDDQEHPGWTKWTATITSTAAAQLQFDISDEFDGYIDDISLVGDKANFRDSFDVHIPSDADYEPSNPFILSAHQDGGVNNVSWRNPISDKLQKITLYKKDGDNWTELKSDFAATPGTVQEYFDQNLDLATLYTYKLKFDFSGGVSSREVVFSRIPIRRSNERKAGNAWTIYDRDGSSPNPYYLPTNVTIDTTEKAEGKASVHIFTNKVYESAGKPPFRQGKTSDWYTSYFTRLQASLASVKTNTYYRLSYKVKVNNATRVEAVSKQVLITGYADNLNGATPTYAAGSTDGWEERSVDLTPRGEQSGGSPLQFYLGSDDVQDLWLDDVKLLALQGGLGSEPEQDAVNLLTDGGFENYTEAEAITGQSAEAGNKAATVHWTMPSDSSYIRVYEVSGENKWLRAVCEPSAESVTLEGLTNDREYTYEIQSQNKNGVLSDPVTVTVTPTAPNYEINAEGFQLTGDGTEKVTKNGTYTVTLGVTNYKEENFAPALIAALYKNDILVGWSKSDNTLDKKEQEQTLTASVTVSDYDANAEYRISAFLWNGFEGMVPLLRTHSFE